MEPHSHGLAENGTTLLVFFIHFRLVFLECVSLPHEGQSITRLFTDNGSKGIVSGDKKL